MSALADSLSAEAVAGREQFAVKPSVQRIVLTQTEAADRTGLLWAGRQMGAPLGAQRGDGGGGRLWHVLYSRHSSLEELMAAVTRLRPRALIPFSGNAPKALASLATHPDPAPFLAAMRR